MAFKLDFHIKAQSKKVFRYLNDPELATRWMNGSVEYLTSNPRVPGAKFKYRVNQMGQSMEIHGELLDYEAHRFLQVRMTTSRFSIDVQYSLRPAKGGTDLSYSQTLNDRSRLSKIVAPVFEGFMKVLVRSQMEKLKDCCEMGGLEASVP